MANLSSRASACAVFGPQHTHLLGVKLSLGHSLYESLGGGAIAESGLAAASFSAQRQRALDSLPRPSRSLNGSDDQLCHGTCGAPSAGLEEDTRRCSASSCRCCARTTRSTTSCTRLRARSTRSAARPLARRELGGAGRRGAGPPEPRARRGGGRRAAARRAVPARAVAVSGVEVVLSFSVSARMNIIFGPHAQARGVSHYYIARTTSLQPDPRITARQWMDGEPPNGSPRRRAGPDKLNGETHATTAGLLAARR